MRTQIICLALVIVLICPFAESQWVQTNGPPSLGVISTLAANGTNLFAVARTGVYFTTDSGSTWTMVNNGLTNTVVFALAVSGTNLFAGTEAAGAFRSTNNGASWTAVNEGLPKTAYDTARYEPIQCLASSGTNLFAGTYGGVFLSTDSGSSWIAANTGLTNTGVVAFAFSGSNIFAGTEAGGAFRSTNNGTIWTAANEGFPKFIYDTARYAPVRSMASSGQNVFVGVFGGVFLFDTNGTSWTAVNTGLTNNDVSALAVCSDGAGGTSLFAGTYLGGVFLSTNTGSSWSHVGYPDATSLSALAVSGGNLFAGMAGVAGCVWRRPLSEMIASVEFAVTTLPSQFSLHQNYPNPFNPSTTIKYELPNSSMVRLSIFDMLGREVSVLVNERKDAGAHELRFDGSSLASGVYFYRLQAGDFTQTKRLILLR